MNSMEELELRNFPLPAPATFVLNKAHQEETLSPLIQCRGTLPERWLEAMSSYKKSGKSLKRTHRERGQVSAVPGRLRAAWIAKLYLVHTYLLALSEKTLRIAGEAQGLCTAGKVSLFYHARIFFFITKPPGTTTRRRNTSSLYKKR